MGSSALAWAHQNCVTLFYPFSSMASSKVNNFFICFASWDHQNGVTLIFVLSWPHQNCVIDQSTPSWIYESFLTASLQSFTVSSAVASGNYYFSHIYRVRVNYKNLQSSSAHTLSLIVKSPVKEEGYHEQLSEKGAFSRKRGKSTLFCFQRSMMALGS
ncbi:hypothetical protein J6590_065954 [Homalodisca vitripennis]|nr:hypothetical protein J6590_065954 [Homalodisca vitripennis]